MAFGVPTQTDGKIVNNLTKNGSAQAANMTDNRGRIEEMTTFGATVTETRDYFLRSGEEYENTATNGQVAAAGSTGVVTGCNYTASENAYERVSETRQSAPAIPQA